MTDAPEMAPLGEFRPHWPRLLAFLAVHLVALLALAFPIEPALLGLCAGTFVFRQLATEVALHRYFAHRAFKTSRPFQLVLGLWANATGMRGPISWAAHHRAHHRRSDLPEDVHSPRYGLWWSHCGWFLSQQFASFDFAPARDLEAVPELRWLERHTAVANHALALGLFLIGGWPWLLWGGIVSLVLCWHATFLINSLSHTWGWQDYETGDDSRNNPLLALLTAGEWHNNHHAYMHSASFARRWWQLDLAYITIWSFARLGLIWEVHPAPEEPAEPAPQPA